MSSSNTETPSLEIAASRQFTSWLKEQNASLVFTTYQVGKLFFVGVDHRDKLSIFNRTFNRVMGLCANSNRLYLSDLYQLWRFENTLQAGQRYKHFDRCYLPQMSWTTGDVDVHDIGLGSDDRPIFVNTLFSCIATVSDTHSFKPIWRPDFISKLAAEDRCHLNGMTVIDGKPAFVTSISQSDVAEGWRDHRQSGGVVIDVQTNDVILKGLSMPHSPRWHNDRLWLLESGTGYFGYVDNKTGVFEHVAFCPGYARGLSFINDYAIIGLSRPRHNKTFDGLSLDDNLSAKKASPRAGLIVVNLQNGDIVHSLTVTGIVEELFDVAAIKGVQTPMAIGFQNDEIRRMVSIETKERS